MMTKKQRRKERIGLFAICLGIVFILVVLPIMQYVYAEHVGLLRLPPPQQWSPHLELELHGGATIPFECDYQHEYNGGLVESIHLATFTDKAGNTVDIYCEWNEFLGSPEQGARQFIAYYNNITVIGQCPFLNGINTYNLMTDDRGIINATTWISVTPNLSESVIYNMTFNTYNQTAMAHRPGVDIGDNVVGLWWLYHSN